MTISATQLGDSEFAGAGRPLTLASSFLAFAAHSVALVSSEHPITWPGGSAAP